MTAPSTGQPTTKRNAMGQSSEDWQSYRLGERIIHTPAVHGAGWQALGWQRLNGLDAPMPVSRQVRWPVALHQSIVTRFN